MAQRLTEHDGRRALQDHLLEKAALARERYGPSIDYPSILKVLDDRAIVRYPVGIRFGSEGLQAGEFAHAMPLGEEPRNGFCLWIHPAFERQAGILPSLIAYHLPPVSYGDIAGASDCEVFGAALLGMGIEDYYSLLCGAADSIAAP